METIALKGICNLYSLISMINKPTCYTNPMNRSRIDLILTNSSKYFQNSNVFETGLSNFHKMVITVMKTSYGKHKPKIVKLQKTYFSNNRFREVLINELRLLSVKMTRDLKRFLGFARRF